MMVYVALLRGINVSGQKKVPMAELRELLSDIGFKKVSTYIQSGNVILQSTETNCEKIKVMLQTAIKKHFGFDVSVLVKTAKEFQQIFDECPFPKAKKEASYFTILQTVPNKEDITLTSQESYPNEKFIITNECVYSYCSTGYGRAKCTTNFFKRKLKVIATARNFKTMTKLLSLSSEIK